MTSETLHTCSYSCTRPACVLAQRNELRAKVEYLQTVANIFANLQQLDEALMRQLLKAWEWVDNGYQEGLPIKVAIQAAIVALRERLEETK